MQKNSKLIFFFLILSIFTYGQKKTPFLQNIRSYIITETDTIKTQRYNGIEYHKLVDITAKSSDGINNYAIANAVMSIEAYLDARSNGEIPDNPYEFENRLNLLNYIAKSYKISFNLENYKKEASYYVLKEEKNLEKIKENKERKEREEQEKKKRIQNELLAQKKFDSIIDSKVREKEVSDSLELARQKTIYELKEKELQKQYTKKSISSKKINNEKRTKQKSEIEKKQEKKINQNIKTTSNKKR